MTREDRIKALQDAQRLLNEALAEASEAESAWRLGLDEEGADPDAWTKGAQAKTLQALSRLGVARYPRFTEEQRDAALFGRWGTVLERLADS